MEERFVHWSFLHLFILILTIFLTFIFIAIATKNNHNSTPKKIAFSLSIILILNFIAYNIYRVHSGFWEIRYDLPMEFCNWSMIVTSIALFTKNQTFSELSYFWVFAGSIQGVITPDLQVSFPHIYFFIFFIAHSGLVIASLYLIFGLKIYPKKYSVIKTFFYTQIFFVAAHITNILLKSNYGYTMRKPLAGSALDYLGEWPFYLISLEVIGLMMFYILYSPFYFINKSKSSQL